MIIGVFMYSCAYWTFCGTGYDSLQMLLKHVKTIYSKENTIYIASSYLQYGSWIRTYFR